MHATLHCGNLMCYFHVKSDCKQYLQQHFIGAAIERDAVWLTISNDLDVIRGAENHDDFRSRADTMVEKWNDAMRAYRSTHIQTFLFRGCC